MLETIKIKLLKLLLNNIYKYDESECREKWIETTIDDIKFLIDTLLTLPDFVWCRSESGFWPNLWFSAFFALRAGVFANFMSLFFLAAAALGLSFCLDNIGELFIYVLSHEKNNI